MALDVFSSWTCFGTPTSKAFVDRLRWNKSTSPTHGSACEYIHVQISLFWQSGFALKAYERLAMCQARIASISEVCEITVDTADKTNAKAFQIISFFVM